MTQLNYRNILGTKINLVIWITESRVDTIRRAALHNQPSD